jgi:Zn-finger protein
LSTFSIHNKMVVNIEMNCHSWHRLESMHNIIDSLLAICNTKRKSMTTFASKQGSRWNHCH